MPKSRIAAKSVKKPKPASKSTRREASDAERRAQAQRMSRSYHAMSSAEKAERRWRQSAKPPVPRKGSVRAGISRNTSLAQAYCDWSDVEEVFRMYVAAAVMTELTGETYVVDHAVPLQSPLVCGLHTHTNMGVITTAENSRKSNWMWPDMWPIEWQTMQLLEQQEDRLQAANDDEHPRSAASVRNTCR